MPGTRCRCGPAAPSAIRRAPSCSFPSTCRLPRCSTRKRKSGFDAVISDGNTAQRGCRMNAIGLSGSWQLSSTDGQHSGPMSVPGDVHTALKVAGVIPDPYYGRNENRVRWVAEQEWLIERQFVIDDPDGAWYLDITYLDTVAVVFVNDVPVLSADNCFRRYRPDVSAALQAGENTIRIHFHSNIAAGAESQARQPSSEESRVGKECVSTGRSRWSRYYYKNKTKTNK